MSVKMVGIDELRTAVEALNNCNETFLNGGQKPFTAEQLLKIWRAWKACAWDIFPDQWTDRQVKRALRGIVPTWDAEMKPTYPSDSAE